MNQIYLEKFMINYCESINQPISNHKLNFILFLINLNFKNKYNKPLISLTFHKNNLGFINKNISDRYRIYGTNPIPKQFNFDINRFKCDNLEYLKERLKILSSYPLFKLSDHIKSLRVYKESEIKYENK